MMLTQKTIVFENGERFPILVSIENGFPHFFSTVFLSRVCREKAANTMRVIAHSIAHLYAWAEINSINIDERFEQGAFFTIAEIESLASAFRLYTSALRGLRKPPSSRGGVYHFPKANSVKSVQPQTVATRIRYAESYLTFLAKNYVHKLAINKKRFRDSEELRKFMRQAILSRIPRVGGRAQLHKRQGLNKEQQELLLEVTYPNHKRNPWKNEVVKLRNFTLILLLSKLGLRAGEALGLKIRDFDFQLNRVKVLRRPDDLEDVRRMEPNVKTIDRILLIDSSLASIVHKFILVRGNHRPSRFNDFLFTSYNSGRPLSYDALFLVFKTLRLNFRNELPVDFSAHILRHTWNDRFSEIAKEQGLSTAEEVKLRSYLCGWKETSGSAAIYTRRYQREYANRISLKMQEAIKSAQ